MKKLFLMAVWAMLAMPLFAQSWSKDLEKAAKNGDVEAQFTVGNAYLTGDGVKQNLKKATQWLFMAAQAGQADAIKTLCTYYSDALEQVAAAGNADAQFALANFYETGNGVAQNQAKALELYGSAAAQGIAEAKPKVLGSYNAGIVTLANAGDADAQFALANFYETGNGVAQNNETAIKWYGKAAVQGIQEAKPKILVVYNEALDTLAAAGDADAQFALANFYAEGNGVAQNTAVALDWYGAAAAQGNAEAKQKVLGSYSSGLVKLAKVGDIDAATQVADFLFNGAGGATKNEKEAAEYYGIAYKAGNATAGTKLVTMYNAYLSGRGVVKNAELANIYLAAAALAGIQEAKDIFYSTMSPQLEQAAESGDPNAMIAIARLHGWCTDENYNCNKTGLKWTLRAIEKGYIDEVLSAMKEDYKMANHDRKRQFSNEGFVDWSRYVFDNDPNYNGIFAYDYLKGWSQRGTSAYESAYYAALLFKEEYKLHGLKSLMNQFKHPKARELYDDWYFQFDCTTYEIGVIDGIGIIKGFNEVPNKVSVSRYAVEVYDFEVPTSEELQKLIEFNPDFAINKDAVRIIRGFRPEKEFTIRWVLDIFMLPGMVAYGPDSYYEIFQYSTKNNGYGSDEISLSNPYRIRFNKFADEDTKFSETINLAETFVSDVVYEGISNRIKSIDTINAEYTIEFKDLELLEHYYVNVSEQEPRFYSVVDGITVELHGSPRKFTIDSYTVKGEDGSEYSLMTKEYCDSIPEDVKPTGYTFYRMSYSKPDGSKMDVLISDGHVMMGENSITFDYMKEHINAALLDSLFIAEKFSTVIAENGAMTQYRNGMLGTEFEALEKQKEEEEWRRQVQAFKEELYKKYDKQMVDRYFKSQGFLQKGVSINLVSDYIDHYYSNPREKWIEFYLTDSDGYGVYELHEGNVIYGFRMTARIYTKNNLITDWVNY